LILNTNNIINIIILILILIKGNKFNEDLFSVELFTSKDMIRIFKDIFLTNNNNNNDYNKRKILSFFNTNEKLDKFKAIISTNYKYILAIQNDGDEIISSKVLYHLKYCQVKPEVESIYTPSFGFKHNFNWMIKSIDMECFNSANNDDKLLEPYLKQFLWSLGPVVWPLQSMIDNDHNLRRIKNNNNCNHHMGFGAAVHISSSTDPVENWLKQCSTIENRHQCLKFPINFVNSLKSNSLTTELVYKISVHPYCSRHNYIIHKNSIQYHRHRLKGIAWINDNNNNNNNNIIRKNAIQLINDTIPNVIKLYPSMFQFLSPNSSTILNINDVNWASHCTGKDSTHRMNNGAVIEFDKYLSPFQMNFNMQ